MSLLAIPFIIYVKFVLFVSVIITGVLAMWSNYRNLIPFVLKFMTERTC